MVCHKEEVIVERNPGLILDFFFYYLFQGVTGDRVTAFTRATLRVTWSVKRRVILSGYLFLGKKNMN